MPERKLKKKNTEFEAKSTNTYCPETIRRLLNTKWTPEITARAEPSVHVVALGVLEMLFSKMTMNPI